MRQNSSCSSSKYVAFRHVIVSHNRAASRRALVHIARCVYVSRNAIWTLKILGNNLAKVKQYLLP